ANLIAIVFDDGLSLRYGLLTRTGGRSHLLCCRSGTRNRGSCRRRWRWCLSLGFGHGRLRAVFFKQRLKRQDDEECERKYQQQPPLHSRFLLRILKVGQIYVPSINCEKLLFCVAQGCCPAVSAFKLKRPLGPEVP